MLTSPAPLSAEMIAPDARLFADRRSQISALAPRGGVVLEIGVAYGEFSEEICQETQPKRFIACDLFDFENYDMALGRHPSEVFAGLSHSEYVRKRLTPLVPHLSVIVGDSGKELSALPNHSCDLVYVDGAHHYEGVVADIGQATRILSPEGLLVFNDYLRWDPWLNAEYGVVTAVNELLCSGEWLVVGFALQRDMFCDIAIRRKVAV